MFAWSSDFKKLQNENDDLKYRNHQLELAVEKQRSLNNFVKEQFDTEISKREATIRGEYQQQIYTITYEELKRFQKQSAEENKSFILAVLKALDKIVDAVKPPVQVTVTKNSPQ